MDELTDDCLGPDGVFFHPDLIMVMAAVSTSPVVTQSRKMLTI